MDTIHIEIIIEWGYFMGPMVHIAHTCDMTYPDWDTHDDSKIE